MASQDTERKLFEKVDSSKLCELTVYPEVEEESIDGGLVTIDGYIYVIAEKSQGYNTGFYKIGKTGNLKERLEDLQTGNARQLCYNGIQKVTNMSAAEYAAHMAVNQYRATDGGGREWYYVPQDNFQHFMSLAGQALTSFLAS